MILAIIDSFYDSKEKHKMCVKITKIVFSEDNSIPKNITQYCLSSKKSLTHLVSMIKIIIPLKLNNLYVSTSNLGFDYGVKNELEQCGYNIIPIEIISENFLNVQ